MVKEKKWEERPCAEEKSGKREAGINYPQFSLVKSPIRGRQREKSFREMKEDRDERDGG